MVHCTKNSVLVAFITIAGLVQVNGKRTNICGDDHILHQKGSIHSPHYPRPYPPHVNCTWTILLPPKSHLTIIFTDFDIEEDKNCTELPCCTSNYLSLPTNGSNAYANFCGNYSPTSPLNLVKDQAIIEFKSSDTKSLSRGFNLSYVIVRTVCETNDFHCLDGTCLPKSVCCDGIAHCPDKSDELQCQGLDCERTYLGMKPCNNAKCLHATLWCDGNDDCGDNSDEENCIRNSVISATIMGCLFCGLMLVIAVMCALRLYTIRNEAATYRIPLPPHVSARLSFTNSISLPALIDDEFFHREPPPAYSVAVGQTDVGLTGIEIEPNIRRSRSRCHRLKPPTPPPSTDTSNQSSPSRGSITSSSYLSNDDSTILGT
ncbi:low-density lipoprotein receptor-related protein 12-like [Cimex lectularius]|uniref:CUB domain-containing protein n=1 Tax=Cimex lectularius TaxID=79782 RepID=A0A8I6S9R2_CIMLE|nr:low-density lipoprotein receptor-related protein 12-like [Cimex lectularius]